MRRTILISVRQRYKKVSADTFGLGPYCLLFEFYGFSEQERAEADKILKKIFEGSCRADYNQKRMYSLNCELNRIDSSETVKLTLKKLFGEPEIATTQVLGPVWRVESTSEDFFGKLKRFGQIISENVIQTNVQNLIPF